MYSVLIPTLWKQDKNLFREVLIDLENSNKVKQIVLIDNEPSFDMSIKNTVLSGVSKLQHLKMKQNLFVNPSWNLGVKHSTEEYIVVLNDDMWFNPSITVLLDVYEKHPQKDLSAFGMSTSCFPDYDDSPLPENLPIEVVSNEGRGTGWGCMFIMNKKNWQDIPEDLKVWFGDDYISNQFSSRNIPLHSFKNVKCTKWSTTLDLPQFDTIKEEDRTLFFSKYNNT